MKQEKETGHEQGMQGIRCAHCDLSIEARDELAVAGRTFTLSSMEPMHVRCYAEAAKEFKAVSLGSEPLNGPIYTTKAALAGVAAVVLALLTSFGPLRWVISAILLIPLLRRSASWVLLERRLPPE